jgi:hypothetical protein
VQEYNKLLQSIITTLKDNVLLTNAKIN